MKGSDIGSNHEQIYEDFTYNDRRFYHAAGFMVIPIGFNIKNSYLFLIKNFYIKETNNAKSSFILIFLHNEKVSVIIKYYG